jgi:hypothetical protein
LATGEVLKVTEYISAGPLIHVLRCDKETKGLVPAYTRSFPFDKKTHPWRIYDIEGESQQIKEAVVSMTSQVNCFGATVFLDELVVAKTEVIPDRFTPSPVLNSRDELVGLSISAWTLLLKEEKDKVDSVEYLIQPWSEISKCVEVLFCKK